MNTSRTECSQGTWYEMSYPFGSWRAAKALCSDGKYRTTRRISEPDTFFSIPCTMQVNRKSVRGFLSFDTDMDPNGNVLIFTAYSYCLNGNQLPDWPKRKDYSEV